MSVLYSIHRDSYASDNGSLYTEDPKPPPTTPPGMVKKTTMYIIVALSVVVTSMMFATTVTVVYLIARNASNHVTENQASDVSANIAPPVSLTSPPVNTTLSQGPTTQAHVQTTIKKHVNTKCSTSTAAPPSSQAQSQGQTTRVPGNQASTTHSAGTAAPPVKQDQGATTTGPAQNAPSQSQSVKVDLPRPVTTFTRWGKTECTCNSEVIYTGLTAGSRYNYHGGSSNVLCLPEEPQFNSSFPGMAGNYLYGSEYNARNTNLKAIFGNELNEHDVPCAVCEVTGSSAMMMFPGRIECYDGWNKQYSGYLMTSHESFNKSMDIICVDAEPDAIDDSGNNENGALFYFVEANGQLLKHGYSKGFEMTCVVCTK